MAKRDIENETAQQAQQDLEKLLRQPPTKRLTRREVVQRNLPLIERLRRQGHGWEVIAGTMREAGVSIKEHTLRQYFYAASSARKPAATNEKDGPTMARDGERLRAAVHAGGAPTAPGAGEATGARGDASAGFDSVSSPTGSDVSEDVLKEESGGQDEAIFVMRVRELIARGQSREDATRTLIAEGTQQVLPEMLEHPAELQLGKQDARRWLDEPGWRVHVATTSGGSRRR